LVSQRAFFFLPLGVQVKRPGIVTEVDPGVDPQVQLGEPVPRFVVYIWLRFSVDAYKKAGNCYKYEPHRILFETKLFRRPAAGN
jgi:hypothetical protein